MINTCPQPPFRESQGKFFAILDHEWQQKRTSPLPPLLDALQDRVGPVQDRRG